MSAARTSAIPSPRAAAPVRVALMLAAAATICLAGCRAGVSSKLDWPDTQVSLRDDGDRDAAIDRIWVMPPGEARDQARAEVAGAIARRIVDAVEDDQPFDAAALLDELTALWQTDPGAIGRGLAAHAELLRRLRALFAKSGALEPTVRVLVVLAEVEPAHRTAHLAELDEVLAFADLLAVSEHGPDATRAQPIGLLQPTAVALPLPWLVDRYVAQLVERQVAVDRLLDTQGASMQLVRAHSDVLSTSRRIAIVLARAGRAGDIYRELARLSTGIGAAADGRDRELRVAAGLVAEQPTPASHLELASRLRTDQRAADPGASLAVALAGLARFPDDPELLAAAGGDARTLGRVEQAIELHERALRGAPDVDAALALRLGKLYADRIARLASAGRPRAADHAWRGVAAFTAEVARRHPHAVWQQVAAIAESALGRGLASQGLIDQGRRALAASIERAPSVDALETLARIDVQTDRFESAQRSVRDALALLGETTIGDRYRRAKLERLSGDGWRRAGKPASAAARYLESLQTWSSLGARKDLPPAIAAERLLETGRLSWWLGDPDRAVDLVLASTDAGADAPTIAASAVAFLLEIGRYRDALDAFHRGLGEPGRSDLHKVYMSLWILGEARRRGEPTDRLAHEYLASRRGDLWHELLARAATGRLGAAALHAAASTGPRRGELAFYGAVLGLEPAAATPAGQRALLERTVAARAVLDAEYDLARIYLAPAGAGAPLLGPATEDEPAPPAPPSARPPTEPARDGAPRAR